ncbi:MAG: hypothetical protein M3Q69_10400, partial [Acidobacteriota bacterium]|nr:hypothetical protein [Acidobacteriota bacterium]
MRRTIAPLLVVAAFAAATFPVRGSFRANFVARHDGRQLAGAEVCFFRAGDVTAPLDAFLQEPDARCLTADQVLTVPPGRWFYYLRHRDGFIGVRPTMLQYRGNPKERDLYDELPTEMLPAATVDFAKLQPALGPDDRVAVFVSNTDTSRLPMIIPVPRGETSAMVPEGMPVLLLRVRNSRVVAVSPALTLKRSDRYELAAFSTPSPGRGTLLTWAEVDDTARTPSDFWDRMSAPVVSLDVGAEKFLPTIPLRASNGVDGALLVFENVPVGAATVRLRGSTWKSAERAVHVPEAFSVADGGLTTRPVASLNVRWTRPDAAAAPSVADCGIEPHEKQSHSPVIRLMACEGLQPGTPGVSLVDLPCTIAVERPSRMEERTAQAWFDDVLPGLYVVELDLPGRPGNRSLVDLRPSTSAKPQVASIDLNDFRVFGRVTVDGEPVRARIEFAHGKTVSSGSGMYDVNLPDEPRARPIRVVPCDAQSEIYTHVPQILLAANARYDINVRPTRLTIRVQDAATAAPLPGLEPYLGMADDDPVAFGESVAHPPATDANGETVVRNIPLDRHLAACVNVPGYTRGCTTSIVRESDTVATATIHLRRRSLRGRIVGSGPVIMGWLYFV